MKIDNLILEKENQSLCQKISSFTYYKYVTFENANNLLQTTWISVSIGLMGRILVADEGSTELRLRNNAKHGLCSQPSRRILQSKIDEESEQAFKKMFVHKRKSSTLV